MLSLTSHHPHSADQVLSWVTWSSGRVWFTCSFPLPSCHHCGVEIGLYWVWLNMVWLWDSSFSFSESKFNRVGGHKAMGDKKRKGFVICESFGNPQSLLWSVWACLLPLISINNSLIVEEKGPSFILAPCQWEPPGGEEALSLALQKCVPTPLMTVILTGHGSPF